LSVNLKTQELMLLRPVQRQISPFGELFNIALEDEMCLWLPGAPSPNRMGALVGALTDLMLGSHFSWVDFLGE
jgi:hypothetical protein